MARLHWYTESTEDKAEEGVMSLDDWNPIIVTELSPFGEWLFNQPRNGLSLREFVDSLGGTAAAKAKWEAEQAS